MDIQKEILKITCQLYGNLRFSRIDVQFIIDLIQNLIANVYNPFLCEKLSNDLNNAVENEVMAEIQKTFKKW